MRKVMDISGNWLVTLADGGEKLFASLPGTLDENGIGQPQPDSLGYLVRRFQYEGCVSFEREIEIPPNWQGRSVLLILERSRETTVWLDHQQLGSSSMLCSSQEFELGEFQAGRHVLKIQVDNTAGIMALPGVRNSHMAVCHTQTNWNGILGRMELLSPDSVHISSVRIYPRLAADSAEIHLEIQSNIASVQNGMVTVMMEGIGEARFPLMLGSGKSRHNLDFSMGQDYKLWDEFSPFLYHAIVKLQLDGPAEDCIEVSFGMREFTSDGTHFLVNGRKVFLRGKHDACVFPLTGYAPMETDAWRKVFAIAKAYGINHYRFHSWCPPEAAFIAADECGIYLQPELPYWDYQTAFEDDEHYAYMGATARNILEAYANHPSFVMLSWGNELVGSMPRMLQLITLYKELDASRLYTIGSNNFLCTPAPPVGADYWTTFWTSGEWDFTKCGYGGKHVRGSSPQSTRGHINNCPPSTLTDYSGSVDGVPMPVISHETGQYQIHPDFDELPKFTGVLHPGNLAFFKDKLAERGRLALAKQYQLASGKLAALCYREDIETVLRTPGLAGFQLLDLQDFPGQGTALVGILDAFMDSKGILTPEQWREFCCETVPLARMKKYVWTDDELLAAEKQTFHVTIPGILPTIMTLVILDIGGIITSGNMQKILLLYNPMTQSKADIIGTYVFRMGITGGNFSYATAVGLFEGLIGLILVTGANKLSKRFTDSALW